MNTGVNLEYVIAGCNRIVGAMHWGEAGLIAYAAQRAVLLYSPETSRVVSTIIGHTDTVNCVRWFSGADFGSSPHNPHQPAALVSGSADGTVCVWLCNTKPTETTTRPWSLAACLEGHSGPITSLTLHRSNTQGEVVLASTAGDGSVLIWHCTANTPDQLLQANWRLVQRLQLPLQHSCALSTLPQDPSVLVLALGGVDAAIRLFTRDSQTAVDTSSIAPEFVPACKLTGHQDWVRSLSFQVAPSGNKLLLASASQDKYVRIWAITTETSTTATNAANGKENTTANGNSQQQQQAGIELLTRFAPKPRFTCGNVTNSNNNNKVVYTAALEALLIGHEDWVHSVDWQPAVVNTPESDNTGSRKLCLLSSSMDRTMMLWVPDEATGLWLSEEAVGDAGANHLGYYTGIFSPDGQAILAHGYTGALHMWVRTPDGCDWTPRHSPGGHVGAVVDCSWAGDDGSCLLTASIDQTVRLSARLPDGNWCEAARPQVHGHDFSAVCAVPWTDGRIRYASTSEEKVIRIFQAPRVFVDTVALLRGQAPTHRPVTSALDEPAYGAVLPALGLSQKALYADSDVDAVRNANVSDIPEAEGLGCAGYAAGPDFAPTCAPSAVAEPPLEEHLSQNTLWPELFKLYGHGNEVFCLAAAPGGDLLASACRAQRPAEAAVWLWNTNNWSPAGKLEGHTLTVTQLAFAPDGQRLASGSRDRSVQVYTRRSTTALHMENVAGDNDDDDSQAPFELTARLKAHSRIVWTLDWSPDSRFLVTGARDNKLKIWDFGLSNTATSSSGNSASTPTAPVATQTFGDSVRSVAFAPLPHTTTESAPSAMSYLVAAGLEDGSIHVLKVTASSSISTSTSSEGDCVVEMEEVWRTTEFEKHAAAVRRLRWRLASEVGEGVYHLASVGDDHATRVFSVSSNVDC